MTTTLEIQRRLLALGYDLGPRRDDGVPGRMTAAAIAALQRAHGLKASGLADAAILAVLFPDRLGQAGERSLPWYEEANRYLGLRETKGPRTQATIAAWLNRLGARWTDDETPWCGTFVGWCIAATLPAEALPANPFGARNWLRFGVPCKPQRGAILVFSRPGSAWSGHVGFYAAEDGSAFQVLGGNQADSVTITRIARGRLLGARWPKSAPAPRGGRVSAAGRQPISTDEA